MTSRKTAERPRRRITVADMQRLARKRGGTCRSAEYINDATHLEWRCALGHEWSATPNNIKRDRWCPVCAHDRVDARLQALVHARAKAKERGGRLLSRELVTAAAKLQWRCAQGHEWQASWTYVRLGTWCPRCSGRARLTLEDAQALARSRGGECLSTRYTNSHTKMRWRSADGHIWSASLMSVRRGRWGPPKNAVPRYDIEGMRQLARARGGKCLSKKYHNVHSRLRWQCAHGHRWQAAPDNVRHGSWCAVCYTGETPTIDHMRKLARSRGGMCLSARYVNDRTKLRWRCARRHAWNAEPNHVKAGTWCPRCAVDERYGARKPVYTLEDMKGLAARNGGTCLSRAYHGMHTPLQWRCASRHEWTTAPAAIRRGSWCPECDRTKRMRRVGYVAAQVSARRSERRHATPASGGAR